MPQVVEPLADIYESVPNRKRWTRAECDFLRESGRLMGRYELLDGEVILRSGEAWGEITEMGHKRPHAVSVISLVEWLIALFGAGRVQCQLPIDVGDADPEHNEPEPDAAVTEQPARSYTDRHPGPEDLVLVAEVSDTTLRLDRTTKAALYALAGVREYWLVDVSGRRLFVHTQPAPEGYREISAYSETEAVATLARPDAAVRVSDLLPPA